MVRSHPDNSKTNKENSSKSARFGQKQGLPVKAKGKKPQRPPLSATKKFSLLLAVVVLLVPMMVPIPSLNAEAARMLGIFLAAIVLWVTEPIPLVATATFVIMAEVLTLSDKAILPVTQEAPKYASFFAALANPVVILFLGGFMLADGAAKFGVDRAIAARFLKPFKGSALATIFGVMCITALLSMFMSNTATTATMFAILMPIFSMLPAGKSRTALALAIPTAANIGGIATPVGTPPNAIAMAALEAAGHPVSFGQWVIMATPYMLIMLLIAWTLIIVIFMPRGVHIDVNIKAEFATGRDPIIFYITAGSTILLWMTEALHGISSNIVGFLPVVVLLSTRVMTGKDLKNIDWPVLWLFGGGIALGNGVSATGLGKWLISCVKWSDLSTFVLLAFLGLFALIISNVISNTATANLLVPLGMSLAVGTLDSQAVSIAVVIAIACSLAMCLPISTPPNAVAYSTGEIVTSQMAKNGLIIGLVGMIILVMIMPFYWSMLSFI